MWPGLIDRMASAQRGFGRAQCLETFARPDDPLQRGVIAFNPVVSVLLVAVFDAVKMRIILEIQAADFFSVGMSFVGANTDWTIKANALNGLL